MSRPIIDRRFPTVTVGSEAEQQIATDVHETMRLETVATFLSIFSFVLLVTEKILDQKKG